MRFRIAGLVCATAFAFLPLSAFSQSAPEAEFRVESSHIEVGPVAAGATATATFVFRNDGGREVRILRAAPS